MGDPLSITASIIAILQAASVTVTYLDGVRHAAKDTKNLIKELGSLQSILTSLRDYAGANPDSTTLQTLYASLQECLSDMEALRAKLEPKGLIRKGVLRLGWVLKSKECREYLDKIERLKSSISLAMDLDRESRSKAIAIRTEKGAENKKRTRVLIWLNPIAYDERHLEISTRRQGNTGEWLLKEEVVVGWAGGKSAPRILVGYGIPGAGKTFLSSLMIDDLRRRAAAAGWGVAFIYFNHSEKNEQTPTFFLSSLVKQFACQLVDLPEQLYELYDHLFGQQLKPSLDQLYNLLLVVTKPFTQAFIICDALDECDKDAQRAKLLPLFDQMVKDGMRLFLTSRPYPEDIHHALQCAATIELSAKNEDIIVYIERKISQNRRVEDLVKQAKCKEKIISMLQTCANGMFLLVHFHIKYLCEQTTPRQLLVALDTLKDSSGRESPMDPTYDRAMKTIQSQPERFFGLAVNILTWLIKSQRVLSVHELQQAVSVEQQQTAFDELALPSEKTMIDVCASLVTIDQESNTVRLVHYTVKEYLVNNPIITKDADFRLVMACATFLSHEGIFGAPLEARYQMYPFLSYAVMHFAFHLQQCDEALSLDLVLRFLKNRLNVLSYLEVFLGDHRVVLEDLDEYHSMLTLAACLGHTSVIQSLLNQGKDATGDEDFRVGALAIAAELGYNSIIEVLLENRSGVAPYMLFRAIMNGHVSTTRLLIDKGASVSATGYQGQTPLHVAADCANEEIVRILVEQGADVSAADNDGQTPLHIAAAPYGSQEIVRILVEQGADVSAADNDGQTPLHIATAPYGSQEVVRILVGKGADVLAKDNGGQTPLHIAAASYGSQEVVRILVEKAADVSTTDGTGQTPLHSASLRKDQQVVKILIGKGADVSAMNNDGQTPLHIAALRNDQKVVQILVEKGADVSATDNNGQTPLHIAVASWILIEKVAGVSTTDGTGQTPLRSASLCKDQQVVQILIEKGADVSAADNDGQTPLHIAAACYGSQEIVRILIEKGADVSAADNDGQTPLHIAAACYGSQEIVRILLEKGADVLATDNRGQTPVHRAKEANITFTAKMLSSIR